VAEIQLPTRLPRTGDTRADGFAVLAIVLMTVGILARTALRKLK
jgi:LPXTG-motif cell wall-anchored protein